MLAVACAGMAAFDWTMDMIFGCYKKENEALCSQVMELTTQIHVVEVNCASQEQKIKNFSAELDLENKERQILLDQVQYLDFRIQEEEKKQEKLRLCNEHERAMGSEIDNMCLELVEQLRETNWWIEEEKRQIEMLKLHQCRAYEKLKNLVCEYDELHKSYINLLDRNEAASKVKKRENVTFQGQRHANSHLWHVSGTKKKTLAKKR